MTIDEQKEIEFNAWLNSIEFVNTAGKIILATLEEDISDDLEGDRE